MKHPSEKINSETKMSEALEILKQEVEDIANSDKAADFAKDNPNWSTLFAKTYPPFQDALDQYNDALKLNEWLNGQNPANGHLSLKEIFLNLTDQHRLSLFTVRTNTTVPSIFDELLRAWWINRY